MAVSLVGAGASVEPTTGNFANVPVHASTAAGDLLWCEVCTADTNSLTFPGPGATVRSVGAKSNTAQPGPDTTAITPGAPIGIATGDLEILVASTIAGATISITANGGGAWTAIDNQDVTSGERIYAWYRIRAGGDGNPSVQPSSDHCVACRIAVTTGTFDTGTPIDDRLVRRRHARQDGAEHFDGLLHLGHGADRDTGIRGQ